LKSSLTAATRFCFGAFLEAFCVSILMAMVTSIPAFFIQSLGAVALAQFS
jgi:hypothetical protein